MKSLLVLLLFHSLSSHAELFRGPLSSSMGGTGRAAMDATEGAFLNPALVPLLKNYQADVYYQDGLLDPGQHRTAYGVGIGDNTEGVMFPGELHYLRIRQTGVASGPVDNELYHLALGRNFGNFSAGISGFRLTSKVQNDREYTQWNWSLGVLYMAHSEMGFGYVIKNIAKAGSEVPAGLREDLEQGIGAFTALGKLARMRVDITRAETDNVDKKLVYMVGFENRMGEYGVFRVGYRYDHRRDQRYATLGAALEGPRLKVDYAFEKNLKGTQEALHSVDMRIPF